MKRTYVRNITRRVDDGTEAEFRVYSDGTMAMTWVDAEGHRMLTDGLVRFGPGGHLIRVEGRPPEFELADAPPEEPTP